MATKITDFATNARLWQTVGPITTDDTTITSPAIDLIDGDGPAFAIVSLKADTGSPSLQGTIEASDNASDWEPIDDAVIELAPSVLAGSITFQRPKRYLRAVLDIENDSEPVTLSVLLGQARKLL